MSQTRRFVYTANHSPGRQTLALLAVLIGFGLVAAAFYFGAQSGHWGPEALRFVVPGLLLGFWGVVAMLQRTEVRIDQDLVRVSKWPFGRALEITRRSTSVEVKVTETRDDETGEWTQHYALWVVGRGRQDESIRVKLATGFPVRRLADELRAGLRDVPTRQTPGGPPAMLEARVEPDIATEAAAVEEQPTSDRRWK